MAIDEHALWAERLAWINTTRAARKLPPLTLNQWLARRPDRGPRPGAFGAARERPGHSESGHRQ